MRLALHEFELPLRHPFGTSRGVIDTIRTLVVELAQGGISGYGEATESRYYGVTIDQMRHVLEDVRPVVESTRLEDPAAFWTQLQPRIAGYPFPQCALDAAAHDLWGKLRGEPVWKLWGLDVDHTPASDYTIGIDAIEGMIRKLEEAPGWPVYKIKLGTREDVQIVRRLRERTDAVFRVDANGGWTVEETIRNAAALEPLGVQFVEQPLPAEDWAGMRAVAKESALPIVADESCRSPGDVERCDECFDGINIKLMKCGGLTPARQMIAEARRRGLTVMIGCMTETTVGISAAAQLAPLVDYADLDGPMLLARDVATGVTLERGRLRYPRENGCGVTLSF